MRVLTAAFLVLLLGGVAFRADAQSCAEPRLCTEMRSCAEADFHFRQCGEAKRDADDDGIPCENICGDTMEMYLLRRTQAGDALNLSAPSFSCSGKHTCGQMTSCEEAQFYLRQCGVASLDRDHDGRACNALCGAGS
ncbi:MAG: excalibur calcium-binding domain-containing protein [Devosia sp.]|nr:excalibur calcium-binding domain-containing protein [Devosia sp.]